MAFAVELRSFDSSQNRLKQRVIATIVQPNVQNKIMQTLLPPHREDLLKERLDRLLFVIRHLIELDIQHALFGQKPIPVLGSGLRHPERGGAGRRRSEEHTSELQSPCNLVCRLLLEKKKKSRCPCIRKTGRHTRQTSWNGDRIRVYAGH